MIVVRDPTTYHSSEPLHMAIGMFDGVHLGHRAVIGSAIGAAKSRGGQSAVMTFTPHPSQILRPSAPTLLIQTEALKEERVAALGVDILIWQTFTNELAGIPANDYVHRLKARFPKLASIHVGENFRYGHNRAGDISSLLASAMKENVHVISIERVRYDGDPISSTRVRNLLGDGHMEEANELLGYNYFCEGKVIHGNQLGRTIGFPTLNIEWQPQAHPLHGVYAVRVSRAGSKGEAWLPGVANFGLRPTIDKKTIIPLIETNIFGDCPFTYDDTLRVEWLHFLRPEKKFDGMASLKAQIAEDSARAKSLLGAE